MYSPSIVIALIVLSKISKLYYSSKNKHFNKYNGGIIMIRTNKAILFLFSLLLSTSLTHTQANLSMPSMPSSEQDMNQIVKELEKATKEIDTFVKALPPAEQEEFNRIVQQVEQKMSQTDPAVLERFLTNQMNPEELDQFLGNVFEGINPPEQQPIQEVATPKPVQKKEEKATPKEISKLDKALDTINTIIKRTDSFIVKAQELPELAGKVKRWGKQGILYDWEPSFEWNNVKKDIESLRQLLQKLIEKDPKNSTYKYLNDFITQDALVNNIEKLKTTLVEYEPTIETTVFGMEKMDAAAKKALTRTISGYTEALYRLKVTADINKIFEKYEPRAKELRDEKEKAEKAAEGAGVRSRYARSEPMVMAGSEGASSYSGYGDSSDYGNYFGGNSSYQQPYDFGSPSYDNRSSEKTNEGEGSEAGGNSGSGGGEGKPGKSSGSTSGKPEEEENGKDKSDKDSSSDKSVKKPAVKKEAEPIEKGLAEATGFIGIVGTMLKLDPVLKDFKDHIISTDPESKPDARMIVQQIDYLQQAKKAIDATKKELEKKKDTQALARVQKRLEEDVIKKHKATFDKFATQIKEIEAMDKKEIPSVEKRIAYLGEEPVVAPKTTKGTQKEVQVEQPQIETVNISNLPKAWDAVQKSIKEFSQVAEPKAPSIPVAPVNPLIPEKPTDPVVNK